MFKTISAALLAVSVLAAPAFAATGKATQAPVIKATQATQIKPAQTKAGALNANAKMGKHYTKHHTKYARHHNHHNKVAAHRSHAKVSYKHASHTPTKRG